ncbi:hypothetical protein CVV38_00540 [Candidatus Peregrinibacteria bacterium HGW-Peregrinibacteria-1]|jgi:hypothetical protein|nr:MAG: hypothetical protein CVV38_00540 [Candidatus Peregrinibacteria bacterium HGW-Peregrinibacteria-1]
MNKAVDSPSDVVRKLGPVETRNGLKSSIDHYKIMPEYKVQYPEIVIRALGKIYEEYNQAFVPLIEKNREAESDYESCLVGPDGGPVNYAVQIDMVGLPDVFLNMSENLSLDEVISVLKGRIFEIENSLAMYQLLGKMFSNGLNGESNFSLRFRDLLNEIRLRHNMKIALLAVTDDKHRGMRELEFGKRDGEMLADDEVVALSGFDKLMGPSEFLEHLEANNGVSDYLLYVRSSEPIAKLRNPKIEVANPLLAIDKIRRAIKAKALTFNVDAPGMDFDRKINDTKAYLSVMGMGYDIGTELDLYSTGFSGHIKRERAYADYEKGARLSDTFVGFLEGREVCPLKVETGETQLRAKPMKASYGCYGHVRGALNDSKMRSALRKGISTRGAYVIQPEFEIPTVIDESSGTTYAYVDRNFMGMANGKPTFIAGFRSLMPTSSEEFKAGRNHGNGDTVHAEISD